MLFDVLSMADRAQLTLIKSNFLSIFPIFHQHRCTQCAVFNKASSLYAVSFVVNCRLSTEKPIFYLRYLRIGNLNTIEHRKQIIMLFIYCCHIVNVCVFVFLFFSFRLFSFVLLIHLNGNRLAGTYKPITSFSFSMFLTLT